MSISTKHNPAPQNTGDPVKLEVQSEVSAAGASAQVKPEKPPRRTFRVRASQNETKVQLT